MANVLDYGTQRTIIHLLVEGNSIRSIERLTGCHRDTIMRLMVRVGNKCRTFLDERLRGLRLRHIQADEIWTFCRKKQAMLTQAEQLNSGLGDQFLYVALDQETKLIATYAIGKRTSEVASAFMLDLAGRIVTETPQLSTDGFNAYPAAVKQAFGDDVAYGTLIKDYTEPVQPGRYGPPSMVGGIETSATRPR